VIQDGNYIK